ncbi:MAG: Skp family chaperone for outer membrane protein [Akkermansiaceae bacterium]|jgi:Skp family chaperone for outer membrane proteins
MNLRIPKIIHQAALLLTLATTSLNAEPQKNFKIGTVDMKKLFDAHPSAIEAQKISNATRALVQKDDKKRFVRITSIYNELKVLSKQSKNPKLTEEEKKKLLKEANGKHEDREAHERERFEFLARRNRALDDTMKAKMKVIIKVIRTEITAYSAREGFDFVFDISGTDPNQKIKPLVTTGATDLTEIMITELAKKKKAP